MIQFEDRLRELRSSKHLTQDEMASHLGIKLRGYQLYEHSDAFPPYKKLLLLADFFDVSLDYLVGRSDIKERR